MEETHTALYDWRIHLSLVFTRIIAVARPEPEWQFCE
jgi:hypothetical protein